MTKIEAIRIVSRCAKLYDMNLCGKQLAIVYQEGDSKLQYIEIVFRKNNFMHLTGIRISRCQKADDFYRNILEQKVKESEIIFKANHTTELKLRILPIIVNIPYSARMIGDYKGYHENLYTEKVTGTTMGCLGLVKHGNEYLPNTALSGDIRDLISKPPGKVLMVLRKTINEAIYSEITYRSKALLVGEDDLYQKLHLKIDKNILDFLAHSK